MPVQDKCAVYFERPVTRSQTKSLNNSNSGTKLSSTNSSRYGYTTAAATTKAVNFTFEHKKKITLKNTWLNNQSFAFLASPSSAASSSTSKFLQTTNGDKSLTMTTNQKNKQNYNCYSTNSSTTTANASHVMNHSATNNDSSSRISAASSNPYRISEWAPDTPEYTPDQYDFDDVFDQSFATALIDDYDYDVPLKYRYDLESEPSSEIEINNNSSPTSSISTTASCSPEYHSPDDCIILEEYTESPISPISPTTSTTSISTASSPIFIDQADEIEGLVVLDNERVTDPFSLAEKKLPITRELLFEIKAHLDLEDTEDAMFWCLCTLAFHSLARINELVTDTQSKEQPLQIEVEQVKAPKVYVVPYACIRIPYKKNEYAKIRHLVVCPSNDDICPLTALSNYCRIRTQEGYASDRDPFFCFKGGEVASRKWFLHKLDPLLPNSDASTYSFRAGGVLDLVAQGRTKPDIRCLGRWDYNSFEHYLNDHPSVLLAFISASITTAYEYGAL
ncbi:13831_t:CDS:2 [Ambispora leptoticha]|uniref:13831_t:CDS:1 n=1 Tax=Ambispora leptoticha TaxID=144679 RepID=A0A9N9EY01_9GLOM|nr:13831_t:CDS:2 [Ambispora leptoticha]